MRISTSLALLVLLGIAASAPCAAGEIYRLRIDLDGDAKPEVIQISTAQEQQDLLRSRVIVKIGSSTYSSEFFSDLSDLPDIRVVAIDRDRTQRQLLLETPEAASCIYHLLAYTPNRLVRLLRFDSGSNCRPPQSLGNGEVSVSTWQGFWEKEDRYRLSSDGLSLIKEPKVLYSVEVAGVAGKSLLLQGAECPSHMVPPGTYVKVKLYDSKSNRYRLQSADGGCGWIPAADLNTLDEILKELPWAG